MEFLQRVTITCFAASYLVTLALELSRFFFRLPVRRWITLGCTMAGLVAHTIFLFAQSRIDLAGGALLSSWDSWCLVSSWLLVASYAVHVSGQPESPAGLILLPLGLILILAGILVGDAGAFSRAESRSLWSTLHGLSLLAGTVVVCFGFAAGLLYLIESYRLKHKKQPERRFRFPSLERLQAINERSLIVSAALLALGLVSGMVINVLGQNAAGARVQWDDPVVWSSGLLFAWLAAAVIFNMSYRPARRGRKVAYLAMASFLFLVMALVVAFAVEHGRSDDRPSPSQSPRQQGAGP